MSSFVPQAAANSAVTVTQATARQTLPMNRMLQPPSCPTEWPDGMSATRSTGIAAHTGKSGGSADFGVVAGHCLSLIPNADGTDMSSQLPRLPVVSTVNAILPSMSCATGFGGLEQAASQ